MEIEPRKHWICVIDDDPWVRDSLAVLLETHGFQVTSHGSGAELLADERHRQAECLIVDHHMPGMDGLATIDALQGNGVEIPTILITGRLDANITARAAKSGVIAVVEKPFAAEQLVEFIRGNLHMPGP